MADERQQTENEARQAADDVAFREYAPGDFDACVAVFLTNVPRYFVDAERQEFEAFLRSLPGPYLVLLGEDGEVVACGGYAVGSDHGVADMCWGMVRQDLHGTGLGRALTEARMRRIVEDASVSEIALNTSQHTMGFYERMGFRTIEILPDGYGPGMDRCEMRWWRDPERMRNR